MDGATKFVARANSRVFRDERTFLRKRSLCNDAVSASPDLLPALVGAPEQTTAGLVSRHPGSQGVGC